MAFRIHDSVVRGEIDNRVKGKVSGRIWVHGRAEPVVLELKGNAWPDLAGCLLKFFNPLQTVPDPHLDSLHPDQQGVIGDLTASRKVRVFDVPLEEALILIRRKEKPPEHMANSLYLEWFSERNGRVVIESTDYVLEISAPQWRMTPEDEAERARQAAAGMEDFMRKLNEAVEQHRRSQKDPAEEWDEHDYEKFMKECDARTDKYLELLDKYGDSDEAEETIAREMGWQTDDEAEDGEELMSIDDLNALCEAVADEQPPEPDPAREGIDWVRTEGGHVAHPLQQRCSDCARRVWQECDELGLTKWEDEDLQQFICEFQTTGAKLAGALNGFAEGHGYRDDAFTVACLKRALDHLHKAQAGLESLAQKHMLPERLAADARKDLFEIREGILELMDEFRGRK